MVEHRDVTTDGLLMNVTRTSDMSADASGYPTQAAPGVFFSVEELQKAPGFGFA